MISSDLFRELRTGLHNKGRAYLVNCQIIFLVPFSVNKIFSKLHSFIQVDLLFKSSFLKPLKHLETPIRIKLVES